VLIESSGGISECGERGANQRVHHMAAAVGVIAAVLMLCLNRIFQMETDFLCEAFLQSVAPSRPCTPP